MTRLLKILYLGMCFCLVAQVSYAQAFTRGGQIQPGSGGSVYNPKPTVSPYLNLLQNNNGAGGVPNYQTLVRPFLDQQQFNNQSQSNVQRLQRQVSGLQNAYSSGRSGGASETGHPTRTMNYLHYYPNKKGR